MTRMRSGVAVLALVGALTGCSAVAPIRPEPVLTQLAPIAWPRNAVTLVVDDRRSDRPASSEMVRAIEMTIREALAPDRPSPCPCYQLTVTVLEHTGYAPGGGSAFWHGQTTLQATLADAGGRELARFDAADHDEQWNAWGSSSGTIAAQQSLRDALRKLVRQMAQRTLPA